MAIRRTLAEFSDDIATADLADDSVTTAKIAADAITTAKIADSVTLVTPNIGTPSAGVATNLTSIPAAAIGGVLPSGVTGGSGLTALGTVTSANLSNTAIVYPAGHVVKSGLLYSANAISHEVTTSSTFVTTANQNGNITTLLSSANSRLEFNCYYGLKVTASTTNGYETMTLRASSSTTTWAVGDDLLGAAGNKNAFFSIYHIPVFIQYHYKAGTASVTSNLTSYNAGDTLYWRVFKSSYDGSTNFYQAHGGSNIIISYKEIAL